MIKLNKEDTNLLYIVLKFTNVKGTTPKVFAEPDQLVALEIWKLLKGAFNVIEKDGQTVIQFKEIEVELNKDQKELILNTIKTFEGFDIESLEIKDRVVNKLK